MKRLTSPSGSQSLLRQAILAVCLVSFAYGQSTSTERTSLKVLAIGNSFSRDAMNDLPFLAHAGGKELIASNAFIGGCSLERHTRHLKQAEAGDPEGTAYKDIPDPITGEKRDWSLIELLTAQPWDIVTLQQWSQLSYKPDTYQPYADELIAAIRRYAPTAEIVVHETWAYREDHEFFSKGDGFTPDKMYAGIRDTYKAFADGKGYRVIPVGDAFDLARRTPRWTYIQDPVFDFKNPPPGALPDQRASLNVGWSWTHTADGTPSFQLDAIHCNSAGQYLAAAVWYQVLFNATRIPEGFTPRELAPDAAADLRVHALAAVRAERARIKPVSIRRATSSSPWFPCSKDSALYEQMKPSRAICRIALLPFIKKCSLAPARPRHSPRRPPARTAI